MSTDDIRPLEQAINGLKYGDSATHHSHWQEVRKLSPINANITRTPIEKLNPVTITLTGIFEGRYAEDNAEVAAYRMARIIDDSKKPQPEVDKEGDQYHLKVSGESAEIIIEACRHNIANYHVVGKENDHYQKLLASVKWESIDEYGGKIHTLRGALPSENREDLRDVADYIIALGLDGYQAKNNPDHAKMNELDLHQHRLHSALALEHPDIEVPRPDYVFIRDKGLLTPSPIINDSRATNVSRMRDFVAENNTSR